MKTSHFVRSVPALAALSMIALAVACGKNGDNKNASVRELRQEEVIIQSYKGVQPDYDPADKINLALASRLLGATIEITKRDEKSEKTDPAVEVMFGALLNKPDTEIKAKGVLREGMLQLLETDGEAGLPEGYGIAATCLKTSNCDRIMVFIAHSDSDADLAAGSMTADETEVSLAGGTVTPVSGGTETSEEPAKPVEVPKLNAPKKASRVALLFVRQQKDDSIRLVWSASATMGGDKFLKGGTQKSVETVKKELGIAPAPAKENAPAPKSEPAAAAPTTAPVEPAAAEAPVATSRPEAPAPAAAADAPDAAAEAADVAN